MIHHYGILVGVCIPHIYSILKIRHEGRALLDDLLKQVLPAVDLDRPLLLHLLERPGACDLESAGPGRPQRLRHRLLLSAPWAASTFAAPSRPLGAADASALTLRL